MAKKKASKKSTRKNKVSKKRGTELTTHKGTGKKKTVLTRKTTKQRMHDVNQNLPTRNEIAELPRWVIVAFAARCARRVFPWYENWQWAEKQHLVAVRQAVRLAEQAGSGDSIDYQFATDASGKAALASKVSGNVYPVTYSAYAASSAANATANAIEHLSGSLSNIATNAETVVKNSCAVGEASDKSGLSSNAANVIAQAIIEDFEYLKVRANSKIWPEDATVPPDDFGPIWPSGPPDGWPEFSRSDKSQLQISEVDRKKVKELLSDTKASLRLDRVESQLSSFQKVIEENGVQDTLDVLRNDLKNLSEEAQGDFSRFRKDASAGEETLNRLSMRLNELREEFDTLEKKTEQSIDEMYAAAEKGMKGIEESLTTQLTTEQPVLFWKTKRDQHKKQFKYWSWGLLGGGTASVLLVGILWYWLFNGVTSLDPWRIGYAVLTGSIILLLLRILTRIVMSHLHLSSEADERGVMMQAYMALAKAGELDESHRALMLQALFRPSTTGLVKEDAVPASVLDLAARVGQGATKGGS